MTTEPRRPLDRDRVAAEALALIDSEGASAFTLERLAVRLHVRPPSLYNHVAGRADIVEGVRDLVVAEMDYSMFAERPWDDAMIEFARSYRQAFAAHPNTVALLFTTPVRATATYRMYETIAAALVRAGWASNEVVLVVASVEYLIAGSVLDRAALGEMFGAAERLGAPTIAEGLHDRGGQLQLADESFELALTSLVDGLRHRFINTGRSSERSGVGRAPGRVS